METAQFVSVVFVQDWGQFQDESGGTAPEWGNWIEMAEYLTQWDYGQETDDAYMGDYPTGEQWGTDDYVFVFPIDGTEYTFTAHPSLHYASLNRKPLN